MSFTDRSEIVVGMAGVAALSAARVAVYGLGGVGGACAMDLVRAGVGYLHVIDFDLVEESNLNRLAFGFRSVVGIPKTEAFLRAAKDINPCVNIMHEEVFFGGTDAHRIIARECSYHADCVDSLNAKVNLIAELRKEGIAFISSMGTAGRIAPERLRIGLMSETHGCPLARSVRQRLGRMHVPLDFPVVWSDEPPVKPAAREVPDQNQNAQGDPGGDAQSSSGMHGTRARLKQGSLPFVPQCAGHFMASWIVRRILEDAHVYPLRT